MSWQEQINDDSVSWLLEHNSPGVRYLALRDLLELSSDDNELLAAKELAHREDPIAIILNEMNESGYWVKAGPGNNPQYRSTVWAIIMLGQLGASVQMDKRIERACYYLLDNALT